MDLAIGVIIGGAFQGVVTSLTNNILSPIIGLFTGGNFDELHLSVFGITIKYGAFITTVFNFIIMAFVIFLLVRGMNRIANLGKKPQPPAAPATKTCPYCITTVPAAATRCPACTSELPKPPPA
jgi:large conductance mechanosensitive channel